MRQPFAILEIAHLAALFSAVEPSAQHSHDRESRIDWVMGPPRDTCGIQASSAVQKEMAAASVDGPEGRLARRGVRASPSQGNLSSSGRYSRLQSDIAAMQRNSATYCEQPEDSAGYRTWLEARAPFATCSVLGSCLKVHSEFRQDHAPSVPQSEILA